MRISYFSIYDAKALIFGSVFSAPSPGAAERMFHQSIHGENTPHSQYPDDYALYQVFDFDDNQGTIVEQYEPPRLVVQGSTLKSI